MPPLFSLSMQLGKLRRGLFQKKKKGAEGRSGCNAMQCCGLLLSYPTFPHVLVYFFLGGAKLIDNK